MTIAQWHAVKTVCAHISRSVETKYRGRRRPYTTNHQYRHKTAHYFLTHNNLSDNYSGSSTVLLPFTLEKYSTKKTQQKILHATIVFLTKILCVSDRNGWPASLKAGRPFFPIESGSPFPRSLSNKSAETSESKGSSDLIPSICSTHPVSLSKMSVRPPQEPVRVTVSGASYRLLHPPSHTPEFSLSRPSRAGEGSRIRLWQSPHEAEANEAVPNRRGVGGPIRRNAVRREIGPASAPSHAERTRNRP